MTRAFNYLKTNKLMTWDSYPFIGATGSCKYNGQGVTTVSGYAQPVAGDPNAMMAAVAQQPVAVGINSRNADFFFYKSGVISSTTCGTTVNHAVLIVGYGTDAATGKPYWLIKNSFGPTWGDKGYLKVLRTTEKGPGICGVLSSLSAYPIL